MKIRKVNPVVKQEETKKLAFLRRFDRVTRSIGGDVEWELYRDKTLVWVNGKFNKRERFSSFYAFEPRDYSELNQQLNEMYIRLLRLRSVDSKDPRLTQLEGIMRGVIYQVSKDLDSESYKANHLYKKHIKKYVKQIFGYYKTHEFNSRECAQMWLDAYKELLEKPEFSSFSDLIKRNYLTFNTAFQYIFEYAYAHKNKEITATQFQEMIMDTYSISAGSLFSIYRDSPAYITKGNWIPVGVETIPQAMDILADWYVNDINSKKIHPIERACILHCELVRIQAFPDGNHRLARLIANETLIQADCLPIGIDFELRERYDKATNTAIEMHEIDDLIEIFYELECENVRKINKCLDRLERRNIRKEEEKELG